MRQKKRTSQNYMLPIHWLLVYTTLYTSLSSAQLVGKIDVFSLKKDNAKSKINVVSDVSVVCNPHNMTVFLSTTTPIFNGIVYPKGLSKNSSCRIEYIDVRKSPIKYLIPLRACNTMAVDVENGLEFFNTIVVQPHRKLVTNHGKGFHIRCRYQTVEKKIVSDFNVRGDLEATPLSGTASMPTTKMQIFYGDPSQGKMAENVKIGDPLTLVVSIDEQNIYGMFVSLCVVKDGLGWAEQLLINEDGCSADRDILGNFEYRAGKTKALVRFSAHKFPYASSVYYQCNIRLCINHAGGCAQVPPNCDLKASVEEIRQKRKRRQTIELDDHDDGYTYDPKQEDVNIKVYSGLYVHEANSLDDFEEENEIAGQISAKSIDSSLICFPRREFAIGIAAAGLVLMICVIVTVLCLISRKKKRRDNSLTGTSSIYSSPYAFSHSS